MGHSDLLGKINRVSTVGTGTSRHKVAIDDLQSDRIRKLRKAIKRQDPRRAQARYNNLFFFQTQRNSML